MIDLIILLIPPYSVASVLYSQLCSNSKSNSRQCPLVSYLLVMAAAVIIPPQIQIILPRQQTPKATVGLHLESCERLVGVVWI